MARKPVSLPKLVNDKLMLVCIGLVKGCYVSVIRAYTLTMIHPGEHKEDVYQTLGSIIRLVPCNDKLIISGDFSATVGHHYASWGNVIGHHRIGNMYSNCLLLLSKCTEYNLVITNKYKMTWMLPGSKHWHMFCR